MFIVILVLLSCTILVSFSEEFAAGFKKLFAIPGMKLLLPLTLVTALIVYYDAWVLWSLLKAREGLRNSAAVVASALPIQQNAYLLAIALILFIIPFFLLMASLLATKEKPTRNYQAYYLGIAILWFFTLVLVVVDINHIG